MECNERTMIHEKRTAKERFGDTHNQGIQNQEV